MSETITIFTEKPTVVCEVGDVMLYRAPDGVLFYGVESAGRCGSDWVGATKDVEQEKEEKPA